jgi:alpha-L-fucosidase
MADTHWDEEAGGKNKITPEGYGALAERFQPDRYDPDVWMKAAAEAGFQYAVLTVMHIDGYTLWPTAHGELGVQSHMNGRDLVGPFVEACRRNGLKVGFYLSPVDWYFDRNHMSFSYPSFSYGEVETRLLSGPTLNTRHEPAVIPPKPAGHVAELRRLFRARAEELVTRYGKIDLMWFDGGVWDNELRDRIRELQPHIVINSRSCDGDFGSEETVHPTRRFAGWHETCHCWGHSDLVSPNGDNLHIWGYQDDERLKSTAWMLELLARLRTWGGNLLINIGPRPNGELPDSAYERLVETAAWMAHSRDSVIGADAGPYPEQCNVPVTVRGSTWYLHALPDFKQPIEVRGTARPKAVTLLRTGESLAIDWLDGTLHVAIAPALRTALDDVVALQWR